ncbi:MAG: zinc ribbon domain-containing protein [Ktedonobacteraceae bacterium]
MSDFLESAKNIVNSAVSRTSWEAQKQLRVRSKQTEVDKLLEQRHHLVDELSQVAMTLYQQGALTDAQLSRLCASIFELDHDLRARETQLQEIKNEPYPTDQFAPGPTMNYAPPSPAPQPSASTRPDPAAQNSTPTGTQGQQNLQPCPQCGSPLRPNALYCRSCGAKLR